MTIPVPNLDNVDFEEIFKQIRHKIPQFSELWSDHNFSDPGITFIELFSWLAEMQIFSLNTISKNNYLKFLQNLGYHPKPPTATELIVNFLPKKKLNKFSISENSFFVSDDDSKKIFQSSENTEILPCHLENAYNFHPKSGYYPLDNLEFEKDDADFEPRPWNLSPFGADMVVGRSLCLGFSNLAKFHGDVFRIFIKIKHDEIEKFPIGYHGSEPTTYSTQCIGSDVSETSSPIFWEWASRLDDSGQPVWEPLNVLSSTSHLTQSGIVSFNIPFKDENKLRIEQNSTRVLPELFWIRCSLACDSYETPPIIDGIFANPVIIKSGQNLSAPEIHFDKLFTSNGLSNQKFLLPRHPVIQIYNLNSVSHSNSFSTIHHKEFWIQVDNFDYSSGTDNHFVINYQTGEIIFGDGEKGKIPEKNATFEINYRYGHAKSSIQNNTEFNLHEDDGDVFEKVAKSRFISRLGNDEESLESLYYRARKDLSVPYIAVTSDDFEYIAKNTPGLRIARTTATLNENSDNSVDITIIPYSSKPNPVPKTSMLDSVCEHIDKHRLLTTSIRVLPPNYVRVTTKVSVRTTSGVSEDLILKKLNNFLSPISRGNHLSGWPVGRSVYKSEISALIEQIPGVDCIDNLTLLGHDNVGSFTYDGENIVIKKEYKTNTFVFSGSHEIQIIHSQQSCKNNQGGSENV